MNEWKPVEAIKISCFGHLNFGFCECYTNTSFQMPKQALVVFENILTFNKGSFLFQRFPLRKMSFNNFSSKKTQHFAKITL